MRLAIVFLDLASFTPLTESMGDLAAAEVVARFSELVREVVNRHHGRVVERIGDAFMLTFAESPSAVACALELFEARPRTAPETDKLLDPVCGMELSRAAVAAWLSLEGAEQAFCSESCLRLFVESRSRQAR